ncbi:MAG TPA: GYD domain-containing protein [Nocardioidaceae bacterium]
MPKYALFFTYTSDAWDSMVEKPRDRAAQARAVVEATDGTMEAIYWMFGPHDGICIFDAPSSVAAGAVSVAVGSTGSFKHLETHELLTQDQLSEMLVTARDSRRRYQPPRQPYAGP